MSLLVGLGNPGNHYASTRHNIGWTVLAHAARKWSIEFSIQGSVQLGEGFLETKPVTLVLSLAWMNQTGPVVKYMLDRFGMPVSDLIVVHDDLDLEPGRIRIKARGGAGGHNGIRSIMASLGTDAFVRIKIGIGRPLPGQDTADFVLSPFSTGEHEIMERIIPYAIEAMECVVLEGIDAASNRFNVRKASGSGGE